MAIQAVLEETHGYYDSRRTESVYKTELVEPGDERTFGTLSFSFYNCQLQYSFRLFVEKGIK